MINILHLNDITIDKNAKGSKRLLQARMTKPHPMTINHLKMNEESVESRKSSEPENIADKINLPSAESDSPTINDTSSVPKRYRF